MMAFYNATTMTISSQLFYPALTGNKTFFYYFHFIALMIK